MNDPDRLWFTRSDWDPVNSAFTAPWKGRLASELPLEMMSTEYVCGAALFFRASVARSVGLFDERFFLVCEDSDWCFRARRAGFGCVTVPSARVWHKIGTSFGSEASPLRTYFNTRNKLLWAEKHVSRREWWHILRGRCAALLLGSLSTGQPQARSHKALLWAVNGFVREWSRKVHDPQEIAHRRGVLDYLFRRFGDCPPRIRAVTQAWARARDAGGQTESG